jgi:hypothetical protein
LEKNVTVWAYLVGPDGQVSLPRLCVFLREDSAAHRARGTRPHDAIFGNWSKKNLQERVDHVEDLLHDGVLSEIVSSLPRYTTKKERERETK